MPQFGIGTEVTTKKTGYPAVGNVVGVVTPELWCNISGAPLDHFKLWHKFYPDWVGKPVVVVKFREPQKPTRIDELQFACPELSEYEIQEMWDQLPKAQCAAYPLDDVEIME